MKIVLFGKRILMTYHHVYYRLSYSDFLTSSNKTLVMFPITKDDYDTLRLSSSLRHMLDEQPNYVKGYGFRDSDSNTVGHLFLMKKGGNEVLYKIRKIDSYLFALRVFSEYQGKGYGEEIMTQVIEELHNDGVDTVFLTVKKNNKQAIHIYDKLGMKAIGRKFFIRIGRYNIPYIEL